MSKLAKITLGLIVMGSLLYFLFPRPTPADPLPPATEESRAAARALNEFGFDLFAKLRQRPGNLCFSPYSIHAALAMAQQGAAGPTAGQLSTALHLDAAARAGQHDLHTRLQSPGSHGFELAVANRVWCDTRAAILPAFKDHLATDFLADAQSVDFATPNAINTINTWISDKTHGRLSGPLGAAMPQPSVILTNALYFRGDWDIPFKKSATIDGDFFPVPGEKIRASLMKQNHEHPFADIEPAGTTPAFRALSLDYTGGDLAMLLLLPENGQLDQLERSLSLDLINTTLQRMSGTHLPVTLPRFTTRDSFNLPPALHELGIVDVFDAKNANFSNLSPTPLWVTDVIHQTFIEVNEKGTEAAASTILAEAASAAPSEKPPEFNADHPFLYLIRDKQTGAILFLGRLSAP